MMGWYFAAAAVLAALALILWNRRKTRRLMDRLERMVDAAIRGEFSEGELDETQVSRLEAKLARYLAASAASARNVQAERDKIKSLIADISHQTRTPLANVLLYVQLLQEQELTDQGRGCAEALEAQAKKLQRLIEALVKMSRLDTGILVLQPAPGSLGPMVEQAAAQFAPRAEEKGLTLVCRPTDAAAVFDPRWTEEALCNLLDNAVKYTPAGGSVTVEVTAYEFFCCIQVRDTGPGIPEAEQAKIFERFYRSEAVRQEEGVGIGLALARQIAENQGGYLKVTSRPGDGARFSLYLPRS